MKSTKLLKHKIWGHKNKKRECHYCSKKMAFHEATIDHYKPKYLGGTDAISNLVLACEKCNKDKGSEDPVVRMFKNLPVLDEPQRP